MKRIGILQLDGKLPNLALMKVAGYYESIGYEVSWYEGPMFAETYEKIYVSKLFSFTSTPPLPENAIIGGTGIDFYNRLPEGIEAATPSYSLYQDCNYHLGFSMKGCRFACKFCCVPKKEGRPKVYNSIDEILINPKGGNRLMLLDNDFFGGTDWQINLERIIELKLRVCFVQGLNIRIITDEQAQLLAKCNFQNSKFNKRYLTFAWDKFKDEKLITAGIERCISAGIAAHQMQFFVLIGFDTTPEQDEYRVEYLRSKGCLPFVMPFDKDNAYQKAYTRYVNQRAVFNSCTWKEYQYNPALSKA